MGKTSLSNEEITQFLTDMPDEVLRHIQFSVPMWQYNATNRAPTDPDGAPTPSSYNVYDLPVENLRQQCREKFDVNPQVNTSVRGTVGRIAGLGFESTSEFEEIQDAIEETELDQRNRLYSFWPQYFGKRYIDGTLNLCLSPHPDGFVEIDYIDPDSITNIIWHPNKTVMPLFYTIKTEDIKGVQQTVQVPSIFIARYPELVFVAKNSARFRFESQKLFRNSSRKYNKLGGYSKFILTWNMGFVSQKAIGYLRTVLTWLNKYEMLKNWEIDHKRSAGAYLWVFSFENVKDFKRWLSLSEQDRKKTGVASIMTPGSRLFLPPGMKLKAELPQLPKISDSDTDILDMITSGLNENEQDLMGRNRGTFASVKGAKGPHTDRTSDEIAYTGRFLKYDFWSSVFFLKTQVAGFPETFRRYEAVSFSKKGKAKFAYKKRRPEELIDISFPVSESIDIESRVKGYLGTKHGPLSQTVGVPLSEVASRIGFNGYGRMRLRHATEEEKYPKLLYADLDSSSAESLQEKAEGEQKAGKNPDQKPDDDQDDDNASGEE
jgi:hypothetical protein